MEFVPEFVFKCSPQEKYIPDYFQIEWNMIVVKVFFLTVNQTEFRLVHNQMENCHHDHIPCDLKRIRNLFP